MDSDSEVFVNLPQNSLQEASKDGVLGKLHYLKPPKIMIGRNQNAEIPINSFQVSRTHATLNHSKKGWTITDNKSFNGVYIDNVRLKPDVPRLLKEGQVVSLGPADASDHKFIFQPPEKKVALPKVAPKAEVSSSQSSDIKDEASSSSALASNLLPQRRTRSKRAKMQTRSKGISKSVEVMELDLEQPSSSTAAIGQCPNQSPDVKFSAEKFTSFGDEDEKDEAYSSKKNCMQYELSLNDRLDVMKNMMKDYEEIDKRIRTILNKSDQHLNDSTEKNDDSDSQASESLLDEREPVFVSDDPLYFNSQIGNNCNNDEDDLAATQPSASENQNYECRKSLLPTSGDNKASNDELKELRSKIAVLQNQMKEQELSLQKALEEKDTIIEQQIQEKEMIKKEGDERLKSALDEAKSFEQSVKDEVGKQFGSLMENELTCVICTELFVKATNLDCSHTFCEKCITTWKQTKKQCPVCRAQIINETRSLVTDNLINKMIEKLSPEFQERRKEVLKEHGIPGEGNAPQKKNTRRVRVSASERRANRARRRNRFDVSTRTHHIVHPHIQPLQAPPPMTVSSALLPMMSIINRLTSATPEVIEIEDDSEPQTSYDAYYGGYGRCYNCGQPGHWANGCPDL